MCMIPVTNMYLLATSSFPSVDTSGYLLPGREVTSLMWTRGILTVTGNVVTYRYPQSDPSKVEFYNYTGAYQQTWNFMNDFDCSGPNLTEPWVVGVKYPTDNSVHGNVQFKYQ